MVRQYVLKELAEVTEQLRASLKPGIELGKFADQLNLTLNQLLPARFRALRGSIIDRHSAVTTELSTIIYDAQRFDGSSCLVPANAAAAVIAGLPFLDIEGFRAAYEQISLVKGLEKDEPANTASGFAPTNVTFGIIFALDSAIPVEQLAEQLDLEHRQHNSRVWPDMLVLLDRGTVNFSMQFPRESVMANFLPPSQGDFLILPAYIHLIACPGGQFAISRMCVLLFTHLGFFAGEDFPDLRQLLQEMPNIGVTIRAYQFNLSRHLVPLREDEYVTSRLVAYVPVRIEAPDGSLLCHLQFVPWQDGAFIRLDGKLPLESLLLFLGQKDATVIRRPTGAISNLLPIKADDFTVMLRRIQAQSNLQVKSEQAPNWIVTKMADEGTSSPFFARLYLGILTLRDQSLTADSERQQFDKRYESILTSLESVRNAAKEIKQAISEHAGKINMKTIIEFHKQGVNITESIDRLLQRNVELFLNSAVRAIKDGLQGLLEELGVNIGFLYQKKSSFEKGVATARKTDADLAEYLAATRKDWSESLIVTRNELHASWVLPKVSYSVNNLLQTVSVTEPQVNGTPISEFVSQMLDRICCFTEELIAYSLAKRLPPFISLTTVPTAKRKPENPQRFQVSLTGGGSKPWQLRFHRMPFDSA